MRIGGLQKISLIDYPGTPAAVVFTQGCNMCCPYCHNPQLVYTSLFEKTLNESEIFDFLKKRRHLLKGVVITGGEPTIQNDLNDFIKKIKDLEFLVKLDTNGTNPKSLIELINEKLVDFIAMDIKSSAEKYNLFFKGDFVLIMESIRIIKSSNIAHTFRTTYDTDIIREEDIDKIRKLTTNSQYTLQECRK